MSFKADYDCFLFVKHALDDAKGDDLERAEAAFKAQDLDQPHGNSGMTRRQILGQFRDHRQRWKEARDWLERKRP